MTKLPRGPKRIARAVLWAAAGVAAGCATDAEPGLTDAHGAAIADSVAAMLSDYSALVVAADYEALLEFYADDPRFVWVEDGRVRYRSRADVREAFEGLRSMNASVETDFRDPVVTALAPGLASVTVELDQRFTPETGEGFAFQGAVTATVIHTEAGWLFLNGHSSAVRDRPGEDPGP